MRSPIPATLISTTLAIILGAAPLAAQNGVTITTRGGQTCISSNGLPDHATGKFPNRGNPHAIRQQNTRVCVPSNPKKGSSPQPVQTPGIATNGVIIRPDTADYYDAASPRRHSRDPASGWLLEAMGARDALGLDNQNAHVDERGLYHYHGMPPALTGVSDTSLIGYAADGFPIHYIGSKARPAWMLKQGSRRTAPGGRHDGTYVEDYEHIRGAGNLDECNGATVNGHYLYFATDGFPFFPRCLYGTQITRIR
ncbi:YHYH protein [Sagittula salina]|uniref:YHYH protein n=1 Tax=Sagittula salina TaxID=2820268 RepID=A0A940S479_9RHOB|nr:YHYH protein [Sagittula salina]MBP0483814.1 YHYH protein [Sagittula salina]